MSGRPKTILRTEVPILGQGTTVQQIEALAEYIRGGFQSIVHDLNVLNNRINKIETESFRRVNVYINPKEPAVKETVQAVKEAVSELLEPEFLEEKDDSTSQDAKEV